MVAFQQPFQLRSWLEESFPMSPSAYRETIGLTYTTGLRLRCTAIVAAGVTLTVYHFTRWIFSSFVTLITLGLSEACENFSERSYSLTQAHMTATWIAFKGVFLPSKVKASIHSLKMEADRTFFQMIDQFNAAFQESVESVCNQRKARAVRLMEKVATKHFFDPMLADLRWKSAQLVERLVDQYPHADEYKYDAIRHAERDIRSFVLEQQKALHSTPFDQKEVDEAFIQKAQSDSIEALKRVCARIYAIWKDHIHLHGAGFDREAYAENYDKRKYGFIRLRLSEMAQKVRQSADIRETYFRFKRTLEEFETWEIREAESLARHLIVKGVS